MGDEVFIGEVGDVNFALFREDMFWGNDQGKFVLEDFCGLELRVARDERDGAEIEAVVQDFVRNVARKHAVNAHLNAGVEFAELSERREKCVDGAFVDAERKFAAFEALEFGEALFDFVAEIDEAFGIVAEKGSCVGQADGACAADEKRLAERVFELANSQTDRRLRAVKTLGGAREAAFLGDHQKNLEFTEIHASPSPA